MLSSWLRAIARVYYPVNLLNADWALGGRQPSDQANRLGLGVHHRHLLLLLSPKAGTHFVVPWRLKSWVDLGTYLSICVRRNDSRNPLANGLYSIFSFVICQTSNRDINLLHPRLKLIICALASVADFMQCLHVISALQWYLGLLV